MIAALAITLYLSCGVPDHVVVERGGAMDRMEIEILAKPQFGLPYEVVGNENIRIHSRAWVLLQQQGRDIQVVNLCGKDTADQLPKTMSIEFGDGHILQAKLW